MGKYGLIIGIAIGATEFRLGVPFFFFAFFCIVYCRTTTNNVDFWQRSSAEVIPVSVSGCMYSLFSARRRNVSDRS